MRLLIITQKVDKNDSILGFFHSWLNALSDRFESLEVIALSVGEYSLAKNTNVYSLGKEKGLGRISYVINFFKILSRLSGKYDAVFVHMNQEYILLAGWYFFLKKIPIFFWRNHPRGNILTRLAVFFSKKVFYTSPQSFTAKFSKSLRMSAGIDTSKFTPEGGEVRSACSVLMVGRISPIKHIEEAIEAISILNVKGLNVSLDIVGEAPEKDMAYKERIMKLIELNQVGQRVNFLGEKKYEELPAIYRSHNLYLNLTESGSFDKTIIEACSCGCLPLVSNESLKDFLPKECLISAKGEEIAKAIDRFSQFEENSDFKKRIGDFVKSQSLSKLIDDLATNINLNV